MLFVVYINFPSNARAEENVLPEGIYEINYQYLKDNTTEVSAANSYLYVPNSGKLIVTDNKILFQHEITTINKEYLPYIGYRLPGQPKAEISGETVTGIEGYQEIHSEITDSGNYLIEYELEDISKAPDVLIHTYMEGVPGYPGGIYDNWYNVQLTVDTSSLPWEVEIDKGPLEQTMADAKHLFADIPPRGTLIANVYSEGEHSYSTAQIALRLNRAQTVFENPNATQAEIDAAIQGLEFAMDSVKREKFFTDKTLSFIVLDSNDENAKLSNYSADFGSKAITLKQTGEFQTVANIPFYNLSENAVIGAASNTAVGGIDTNRISKVNLVERQNNLAFYQLNIRHASAGDDVWQGISHVQYTDSGITKEVYLSFNVDLQQTLARMISVGQKLYDNISEDYELDEYQANEADKETLKDTLGKAIEVSDHLAATRPNIKAVSNELDTAIFKILSKKESLDIGKYLLDVKDKLIQQSSLFVQDNGKIVWEIVPENGTSVVYLINERTGERLYNNNANQFTNIDVTAPYTIILSDGENESALFTYIAFNNTELIQEETTPGENEEETAPGENEEETTPGENEEETVPGENEEETVPGENEEETVPGENEEETVPGENEEETVPGENEEETVSGENEEETTPGENQKGTDLEENNLGEELPDTATNYYNQIIAGVLLAGIGLTWIVRKKKQMV